MSPAPFAVLRRCLAAPFLIGLVLALAPASAEATDTYWQRAPGSPGDWLSPANWSTFRLPTAADRTYIDNGGTAQVLSGSPRAGSLHVGYDNTGHVVQSGGDLQMPWEFYLGYQAGSEGTYGLTDGSLSCRRFYVGYYGDGTFRHDGGTVTVADSLYTSTFGGNSLYVLDGTGVLNTTRVSIGVRGPGMFRHVSGTHNVAEELHLGGFGTYELAGTGVLNADYETVGQYETGPGLFRQVGGNHTVGQLWIHPAGRYEFSAGRLEVSRRLLLEGELAVPEVGGTLVLGPGAFTDLSGAGDLIVGGEHLVVQTGPASLVMLPAGFDPAVRFGSFTGGAEVHHPGMTLNVPAGCTAVLLYGLADHVVCRGTLASHAPLTGGLEIRGGTVGGSYSPRTDIEVDDDVSGIWAGQLYGSTLYVGSQALGRFTQAGGAIDLQRDVVVGSEAGSQGTYEMQSGTLRASEIQTGHYGTGVFQQTGGNVALGNMMFVGYRQGSTGTCEMSGGTFTARAISLGQDGNAEFHHTGGTVTLGDEEGGGLWIAEETGSVGTYDLGGPARLQTEYLYVGTRGDGRFRQTGGVCDVPQEMHVGRHRSGTGEYELTGGSFTAGRVYVGPVGPGLFRQSAGTALPTYLMVGVQGRYEYTGGSLRVGRRLDLEGGVFDFADSQTSLQAYSGSMMNFAGGEIRRAANASIQAAMNTLVIFPAGFDPHDPAQLGSYTSSGVTHIAGSGPLVVPAGLQFTGWGELAEHIQCYGTIATGTRDGTEGFHLDGTLDLFPGASAQFANLTLRDEPSQISGGTLIFYGHMYAAKTGTGKVVQTGGTVRGVPDPDEAFRTGHLVIGSSHYSSGVYELHDGYVDVQELIVGGGGDAVLTQTGGRVDIEEKLDVGEETHNAFYDLQAGDVTVAGYVRVAGRVEQRGGTFSVGGDLTLRGTDSRYELLGGRLNVGGRILKQYPDSELVLGGGCLNVGGGQKLQFTRLCFGAEAGTPSDFELAGGGLESEEMVVGEHGTGTFRQTGGENHVSQTLRLGVWSGSYGGYTISAGLLATVDFLVGEGGTGMLTMDSVNADVVISGRARFGPEATLACVPGATIRFTGSAFENESTDPSNMADLANIVFQFEGGPADLDPFEVAGTDFGRSLAGFDGNFCLGALHVGTAGKTGRVQLVDLFDNGGDGPANEVLYVEQLVVGPGSLLDLNGRRLYYRQAAIDPEAVIQGGTPTYVPEPATLALAALGALLAVGRRRPRA